MKKNISSGSKYENSIGFSRACRSGSYIAVSGTAAIKDGKTIGIDDVYKQTKQCLTIAQRAIEEAGGLIADVIRTRIMLVDIKHWQEAAKAHGEFFREIKPATTFVEVKGFIGPEWLVEIEVDCIVQQN